MRWSVTSPYLLAILIIFQSVDCKDRLPKSEFDACVKKCGDQYEDCASRIKQLWQNFSANKGKIVRTLDSCCLRGELEKNSPSTLSFATCVRNECGAEMWGCNVKKRHTGFLSKEEKEAILNKERAAKKKAAEGKQTK
ncbi:uncharacterized protein DEA37_0004270 [Paragonimus westermani]|uniref:Uncharacterized protein n=1 Tax=Paragonimus westermani TaxID=34504 RepID=A0A5J4NEH0_9TREM|nr:uncharacterized protein DEA37_0004270 [Paragonimus westermani]